MLHGIGNTFYSLYQTTLGHPVLASTVSRLGSAALSYQGLALIVSAVALVALGVFVYNRIVHATEERAFKLGEGAFGFAPQTLRAEVRAEVRAKVRAKVRTNEGIRDDLEMVRRPLRQIITMDPMDDSLMLCDRDADEWFPPSLASAPSILTEAEPVGARALGPRAVSFSDEFLRGKLSEPKSQWSHTLGAPLRALHSASTFAGNALFGSEKRPFPEFDTERPNRIAAIAALRKGQLLSSSIIGEVAFELEQAYPHLTFAAEGSEKMCSVPIPQREAGKSLYVVPVILDTSIDHIVTFAFDMDQNRLEYFDPQGLTILDREGITLANQGRPKLIDIYFEMMRQLGNSETRVIENRAQIQKDIHNCGAHALDYVYKRAQGMSAENAQRLGTQSIASFRQRIDDILCYALRRGPVSDPEVQFGEGIKSEEDFQAVWREALEDSYS